MFSKDGKPNSNIIIFKGYSFVLNIGALFSFICQLDLKQYGIKHLPDDINKGKVEVVCAFVYIRILVPQNIRSDS